MIEYRYEWEVLLVKCSKCWLFKKVSDYAKWKWMFWIHSYCKACNNFDRHLNYQKNKEHVVLKSREYYKLNKDKCKETRMKYRSLNRDSLNKHNREYEKNKNKELGFSRSSFHRKAKDYVKKYGLRPYVCSICWLNWKIEMHHPSYDSFDKRSEVVFCCASCHQRIHAWTMECPKPINLLD